MNEILPKELYNRLILHGLFSEKLPPVFDGTTFSTYCRRTDRPAFRKAPYAAVDYDNVRHNNQLRHINIPAPMSYELLVRYLREHWAELQEYFSATTKHQHYVVSRVHVRKLQTHNALFALNYHNFRTDGFPDFELRVKANYLVTADISQFFASIELAEIERALMKPWQDDATLGDKKPQSISWLPELGRRISNLNSGEQQGLLIGPHVCNLLSEILLCRVDQRLSRHWQYTRSIDDFRCFVKNREDAETFLALLSLELEERGMSMNPSKTSIRDLPLALMEEWPRRMRNYAARVWREKDCNISTGELEALIDFSIKLMLEQNNDGAVINYMLSILSGHYLNRYVATHLAESLFGLSFSRPYLIPLLGPKFFDKCPMARFDLFPRYADDLYQHFLKQWRAGDIPAEPLSYLLYYARNYNYPLRHFQIEQVIDCDDCILLLMALIYCRHFGDKKAMRALRTRARGLKREQGMDKYWLFLYEILPPSAMAGDWRKMKLAGVSFLKGGFR